jgi:phage FluMu gp28-like protein
MNATIKENLVQIQEVANKALQEYINSTEPKDRFSGVNYADLQVVDVYVKYSIHDEDLEYGVLIEECSPTAYEFQEYMIEYLKENLPEHLSGFVNVETAW